MEKIKRVNITTAFPDYEGEKGEGKEKEDGGGDGGSTSMD